MPEYNAGVCCRLVGNFIIDTNNHKVISITSRTNSTIQLIQEGTQSAVLKGPLTGTVSITAYATLQRYHGCPGRAGVTIPWVQKQSCEYTKFIFGGQGTSYISGYDGSIVQFPSLPGEAQNPVFQHNVFSASAASGPATIYEDAIQYDGFGLIYNDGYWNINTLNEDDCKFNLTTELALGGVQTEYYTECYLQSLSINFNPGEIPIVSLDFIYPIDKEA